MRVPSDMVIGAPELPERLEWIGAEPVTMGRLLGRTVLLEFWDFCRPNSLHTLPYLRAWWERYRAAGLRVLGVHCPGFPPSRDPDAVRAAVARLGIEYPVIIDPDFLIWRAYENEGWPARYLWDRRGLLVEQHYGEGAYVETELAIQELVGTEREPVEPVRPEDAPGAVLAPTVPEDQPGAYRGPYAAGAVWAVLDGHGAVSVGGRTIAVDGPGAVALVEHPRHTEGELELEVGRGVHCHATLFTPGLA